MRFANSAGAALVALANLACQQSGPGSAGDAPAAGESAARSEPAGQVDSSGAEHRDHAAATEEPPPISTRAEDAARDAGEKPQEVMDALGIGRGNTVADVMAGGGYYTYLLAERVGPDGKVYATAAEGVARRMEGGDLGGRGNIEVVADLGDVPARTLDAVLINRAYHLLNQPGEAFFPALHRSLKPGGRIGVIEVRLSQPSGHDMKTHRMGQESVREELEQAGFTLVAAPEILANPDDPRTDFMEGKRHLADRMFLVFEKRVAGSAAEEG